MFSSKRNGNRIGKEGGISRRRHDGLYPKRPLAGTKARIPFPVLVVFNSKICQQNIAEKVVTCQEVVDEITNKRQLRRLVVLPYDLAIKPVFPENVRAVTEFAKKTGDYPSLSATDIKVMALTYQLEKEHVGTDHLRTEPVVRKEVNVYASKSNGIEVTPDITGFHLPGSGAKKGPQGEEAGEMEQEGVSGKDVQTSGKNKNLFCRFTGK